MDELNKRIVEIMVRFNHSKSSLATELGVSLPLITHITTGRNKPGIELLQRVLQRFPDLDPMWLFLGDGVMMKPAPKQVDLSPVLSKMNELNTLVNNALEVNKTMLDYHKLLLDEVLHLQEMSIQIQHATHDLDQLKVKLEYIKEDLRNI
jgi:transcriptional regulator with XRE-family HTH domain